VSQPLSSDDVRYVARLARLELSDADVDRYTGQLLGMLEHFSDIDALDLDHVAPMTRPLSLSNVFRDDVVTPSLDRDEVLAAAPAPEQNRFRVPNIMGEES
jgi:aspartyl-tRNA(Asn)/glutamyl-tRNA(Gln) amidotransferase subunit C